MSELVPKQFQGWEVNGEPEVYDRQTIFDYIDGAGEVYLAYGFRKLMVFRLTKTGEPTIVVEIFDMGSSEDAFGIFSHVREGEDPGIGQGSEYRGSLLYFWKANFFLCIVSEGDTPEAKKAVLDLATTIAGNITVTGAKPTLLDALPPEGLEDKSVRYFHLHTSLNYHYYVASENVLRLHAKTEAVLAEYKPSGSYLLCIRYPDADEAKVALQSFLKAYIPEQRESGIARAENGKWVATGSERMFVVVFFDAPSESDAQALLGATLSRIENVRQVR